MLLSGCRLKWVPALEAGSFWKPLRWPGGGPTLPLPLVQHRGGLDPPDGHLSLPSPCSSTGGRAGEGGVACVRMSCCRVLPLQVCFKRCGPPVPPGPGFIRVHSFALSYGRLEEFVWAGRAERGEPEPPGPGLVPRVCERGGRIGHGIGHRLRHPSELALAPRIPHQVHFYVLVCLSKCMPAASPVAGAQPARWEHWCILGEAQHQGPRVPGLGRVDGGDMGGREEMAGIGMGPPVSVVTPMPEAGGSCERCPRVPFVLCVSWFLFSVF